MKILHISTTDAGGAANSAIRLHKGLLEIGEDSNILFLERNNNTIPKSMYWRRKKLSIEKVLLKKLGLFSSVEDKNFKVTKGLSTDYEAISFPTSSYDITALPEIRKFDIINLHSVGGFIDYPTFFPRINKPIVWTLHDMNPIMGLFHYKGDLIRNILDYKDLEEDAVEFKRKILQGFTGKLNIVTPSKWLAEEASKSKILGNFQIDVIKYGIPANIFKPYHDKAILKEILGIPKDKFMLLFVSDSLDHKRKGIDLLLKALEKLEKEKFISVALGSYIGGRNNSNSNIIYLNKIVHEEYIRLFYAAADVFVIPSYEDNLPNTVLESMSCGTSVIGFDIGGIPDMIDDGRTGFLIKPYDIDQLCDKIRVLIQNREIVKSMGHNGREKILNQFKLEEQAKNYLQIYERFY